MKITEKLKRTSSQPQDYSTLISGATVSFIGKLIGRGLNIILMVTLAKWLGPELFGVYAITWTLLRVLGLITPLGLNLAVIRFGTEFVHNEPVRFKGVVKQSWLIAILAGGIFSILFYMVTPFITEIYNEPALRSALRWLAPAFLFWAGIRLAVATTKITKRMTFAVLIGDVLRPGIHLLVIFGLIQYGFGLTESVVSLVVSLAVTFMVGLLLTLRLFPILRSPGIKSKSEARSLVSFSIPAILAVATGAYLYWVDRLMMGIWLPARDVGIYQAMGQFSFIFTVILNSLNAVMLPIIAEQLHRNNRSDLNKLFRVAAKWSVYISLPIFLVMFLEPSLLIEVVFGSEYVIGKVVLLILITTQLINVSTGAVNHLLIMSGNQKMWFRLSLIALLVNIGLNVLLLPRLGMEGSAWATAVSITGLFLAGIWQSRQRLGIWPYDKRYLKGLAATGATLVGLLLWRQWIQLPEIPYLILMFIFSGCLFLSILLLLGLDDEDDALVALFQSYMNKLRKAF